MTSTFNTNAAAASATIYDDIHIIAAETNKLEKEKEDANKDKEAESSKTDEQKEEIIKDTEVKKAKIKKITKRTDITINEKNLYTKQANKTKFKTAEEENEYAKQNQKKCSKCNLMKTLIEYAGNTSGCDAFDMDGYRLRRPECKNCSKEIAKGKTESKKNAKNLGISYEAPDGTKCALCGELSKKGDRLVFDHCHKTNTFRGYLHNSCNRSLGVLGDDINGMLRAINFLNKFEKKKITQNINTGELTII